MKPPPHILIIAGPNGAGKTTFAREFLPLEAQCPVFINADLIAAGLSPFAPEVAAEEARRTHTLMVIAENDQLLHISSQDYLEKTNSDPSKLAQ